jgi:hypothetical protein
MINWYGQGHRNVINKWPLGLCPLTTSERFDLTGKGTTLKAVLGTRSVVHQ